MRKLHISVVLLQLLTTVDLAAAADAAAFETYCARCHERASTLARRLEGTTDDERARALTQFLMTHHVEDADARAAIVDYLVGLAK